LKKTVSFLIEPADIFTLNVLREKKIYMCMYIYIYVHLHTHSQMVKAA